MGEGLSTVTQGSPETHLAFMGVGCACTSLSPTQVNHSIVLCERIKAHVVCTV